jgi:predicted phosphodiesterase
MRFLVISDIHANWEALQAVLADAEGLYQQVVCLGDVVGYGPDPNAVTAWAKVNCFAIIRGNHDRASVDLEEAQYFNPMAGAAAEWTNSVLEEVHEAYLKELAMGPVRVDGFEIVHGSPDDEDAYLITPADALGPLDLADRGLVFFGHTHVQGGFYRPEFSGAVVAIHTSELFAVERRRPLLVNPGSVGQPRDNDWRAAYAIYDSSTSEIEFRRCGYDLDTTQRKIIEAGLPSMLAERLALGR